MTPANTPPAIQDLYGKSYFDEPGRLGASAYTREEPAWLEHFGRFARSIVEKLGAKTVADVGCAKGFLVESLRDLGVEAWGTDVSEYAISQVREDIRPFCSVASAWDALPLASYDLVTCIEVAEHLTAEDGRKTVRALCDKSDAVLFSSTPSDFTEPTHINVQPAEYWQALFAEHEFYPDYNFDATFVTPQAVLFRKQKKAALKVAVFSHEPPTCAVALLRLAGIIQTLEQAGRMELCYVTAKDVTFDPEAVLACEIFVIHREFADRRYCKDVVRAARELGRIIVFELDDLLINVPHSNPNHKYCESITPDVLDMVGQADFVTVTTEPLRRELETARPEAKGRIHVLPNYINLDIWGGGRIAPPDRSGPVVIGWFGTATHDEDLAVIKPAILQIARKYAGKVVFKFWGYLPKDLEGIPGVVMARGSQPNIKLHARDVVNSQIDFAIAPLIDHPFNHSKSNLKWLEYSICYFPGIYSRITPYTDFVTHGETGWIVDNTTEAWVDAMEKFIQDRGLRLSVAQKAYDEVRSRFCLDTGSKRWDGLYRGFSVSGPRQNAASDLPEEARRARAHAALVAYKGSAMAVHAKITEAVGFFGQALSEYTKGDEWLDGTIQKVFCLFQSALANRPVTNPVNPMIEAARTIAAKHPAAAIEILVKALKTAEKSNNATWILEALLNVGQEFITLDRSRAQQVLQMGLQLAQNIKAAPAVEHAKKLLEKLKQAKNNATVRSAPALSSSRIQAETAPAALPESPAPATASQPLSRNAVSIVIPTFNKLDLTARCLQLIQENTPAGSFEIVVVDNGSTDGTVRFLKQEQSAGRLAALFNGKNLGFAAACNQGARAARTDFVLFLNNDTEPRPGWLEPLVATLLDDPAAAAAGSKLLFADGTIQHAGVALAEARGRDPLVAYHPHAKEPAESAPANQRRICSALTAACVLVRKSMFDAVAGFDEGYWNGYEDVDLCLKLKERGWVCVYEPRSVVLHLESQSGPERFRKVRENIIRLHSKWLGKVTPDIVIESSEPFPPRQHPAPRLYKTPASEAAAASGAATSAGGPLTSILILAHNQLDHSKKCLASIYERTSEPFEIIFVDNGSTDGTAEWLREQAAAHSNLSVVINAANRGFAAGNNQALALAKGEYAVLLNNDTVVTAGWLEGMRSVFEKHPQTGLVGPVSNFVSGPQLVPNVGYQDLSEMPRFAAEWRSRRAGESTRAVRLVGFCLMAKKVVIDRVGGLDESFGSGNFEDDDFCLRAGLAGFEARIAVDVFIHHTGSQTFKGAKIDYRASMLRNWEIFKKKWSMPANSPVEAGYRLPLRLADPAALKFPLPLPAAPAPAAARPALEAEPAVASDAAAHSLENLGSLSEAKSLLANGSHAPAWQAALEAVRVRPFHPEAHLLLGQIALAAGDSATARQCAEQARRMAPNWKAARKFLKDIPANAESSPAPWAALPAAPAAPRLSVCLIAKNEEQFIGRALESVKPIAHEIIVLDTGSSDRTVEIARGHGAKVCSFDWCDDFSAARNAALVHATGDWILSLDADEELLPEGRERLIKEIRDPQVFAYRMPLMDVNKEANGVGYVPRLFRNAPGLYFTGIIHEQIFNRVEVLRKEWGLENKLGSATLLHHGYTSEVASSRNKNERNLRLLERAVTLAPGDANLVMNLGLELVKSGRLQEGIDKYLEAFALLSAQPASDVPPELREVLLTQLGIHLMAAQRPEEVVRLWQSPLAKTAAPTASMHFTLALAHLKQKDFKKALEEMRQCVAKRNRPALSPGLSEIRKARPHHCIAECLWALGQPADAGRAFQAALQDDPQSRPVRFDYARFLADRNEPVEALKLLHALIEENQRDAAAWQLGGTISLRGAEFLEFACDWTAEAVKALPADPVLQDQRARALLFSNDTRGAASIWKPLASGQNPAALAGLIMTEIVHGDAPSEVAAAAERRASQEFLKLYRQLISMNAMSAVEGVNRRADAVREVLPSAGKIIASAILEAGEPVAG